MRLRPVIIIQCGIDEVAIAAFLDIEGAFRNTSIESTYGSAETRGISDTVNRWMHSMFKSRTVRTLLRGNEVKAKVSRGCPKGRVISSTQWALVLNDLIRVLSESGFYTQGYVDDLTILVTEKHEGTLVELMQSALNV